MINPLMPGNLLDQCRLDLSHFSKIILEQNINLQNIQRRVGSDEEFSIKYFLNTLYCFVREISPKLSSSFGCYRHEWVEYLNLN